MGLTPRINKCLTKHLIIGTNVTIRAAILSIIIDAIEIPHVLNTYNFNSYTPCHTCDFVRKAAPQIIGNKVNHCYRFSNKKSTENSRITRDLRKMIENNCDVQPPFIKGPSSFVEN